MSYIFQVPLPVDGRINKYLRDQTEQFPYVFHMHITPIRGCIVVNHPRTIKQMMKSTEPKDVKLGGAYSHLLPWLGKVIVNELVTLVKSNLFEAWAHMKNCCWFQIEFIVLLHIVIKLMSAIEYAFVELVMVSIEP